MKNFIVILFAISILNCEQNKPAEQEKVEKTVKNSVQKYDSLNWNSVKINGEIPLFTNQNVLQKLFSKPDSISEKMDDCGMYFWHKDYKKMYFKGVEFEATEDSFVFRSVDFRNSDIFLSTDKFRFDKNTTTDDLQEYFPNSFSHKMERETYGLGMVKSMQLNLTDYRDDELWILFFDDKKLIRIDYWIGC